MALIEEHFALPETDDATPSTRDYVTVALLGLVAASGTVVAALLRPRRPTRSIS